MKPCETVTKASAGVARLGGSLLLALALLQPAQAGETQIVIGTASSTGVYHITGQAFCRLIEGPCHARPSEGSVANLRDLRHGEVPIALAQSDQQYHAVEGRENFADTGPDDSLRALFSVHSEPFTLVVRREAGIQGFDDLKQRAVNIGNPGSGQRATMLQLMSARGWSLDDFALVNELPADQQSLELCHGNIDAMVYTVGHPDLTIRQAVDLCNAAVVGVEGDFVEALVDDAPYYSLAEIPAGLYYPEQPEVKTFGVRATVVASEATDPDQVYTLVAAVFDNFERFTAFHPAYSVLEPERMIKEGLSAPLHEGALRYYRERGWIEDEANGEENDAADEAETNAETD
ncbi:TAXI family TRAP transporter solute-binding subunit [Billgrantia montanilacus]|uniref:C4-dicarboxylate ABC transporter substrate-binding protein n=1 Tax=Billgrantia montanilacus TaxID=2282305 RepID=A0A368U3Z2_9GAMM|nr:TAXI family TRAP transporter solute-binding subunit [Halomonas montanilacus]RCV91256.1 C4-dicarboxylate ABC transporter substrate-binding protein [Halomonas montanilacus]